MFFLLAMASCNFSGDVEDLPLQPTNFKVDILNQDVVLSWRFDQSLGNVASYWIFQSESPQSLEKLLQVDVSHKTMLISGLITTKTYYFSIATVSSNGVLSPLVEPIAVKIGGSSSQSSIAPFDFQVDAGIQSVYLSWWPGIDPDMKGYIIYRGTSQDYLSELDRIEGQHSYYIDAKVTSGDTLYYAVGIISKDDEITHITDIKSVVVGDVQLPTYPHGLSAVPGQGKVTLQWQPAIDSSIIKYTVWVGESESTLKAKETISASEFAYIVNPLTNMIPYFFSVTAHDIQGRISDKAPIISAIPAADFQEPPPPPVCGFHLQSSLNGLWAQWRKPSIDNLDYYEISYGLTPWDLSTVIIASRYVQEILIPQLNSGVHYYAYIVAVDLHGNSSQSSPVVSAQVELPKDFASFIEIDGDYIEVNWQAGEYQCYQYEILWRTRDLQGQSQVLKKETLNQAARFSQLINPVECQLLNAKINCLDINSQLIATSETQDVMYTSPTAWRWIATSGDGRNDSHSGTVALMDEVLYWQYQSRMAYPMEIHCDDGAICFLPHYGVWQAKQGQDTIYIPQELMSSQKTTAVSWQELNEVPWPMFLMHCDFIDNTWEMEASWQGIQVTSDKVEAINGTFSLSEQGLASIVFNDGESLISCLDNKRQIQSRFYSSNDGNILIEPITCDGHQLTIQAWRNARDVMFVLDGNSLHIIAQGQQQDAYPEQEQSIQFSQRRVISISEKYATSYLGLYQENKVALELFNESIDNYEAYVGELYADGLSLSGPHSSIFSTVVDGTSSGGLVMYEDDQYLLVTDTIYEIDQLSFPAHLQGVSLVQQGQPIWGDEWNTQSMMTELSCEGNRVTITMSDADTDASYVGILYPITPSRFIWASSHHSYDWLQFIAAEQNDWMVLFSRARGLHRETQELCLGLAGESIAQLPSANDYWVGTWSMVPNVFSHLGYYPIQVERDNASYRIDQDANISGQVLANWGGGMRIESDERQFITTQDGIMVETTSPYEGSSFHGQQFVVQYLNGFLASAQTEAVYIDGASYHIDRVTTWLPLSANTNPNYTIQFQLWFEEQGVPFNNTYSVETYERWLGTIKLDYSQFIIEGHICGLTHCEYQILQGAVTIGAPNEYYLSIDGSHAYPSLRLVVNSDIGIAQFVGVDLSYSHGRMYGWGLVVKDES